MKNNDLLSGCRTPELIATYEDLYRVPKEERITYYCRGYGGHFFENGTAEDAICAAYEKALAAIQMSSDEFQQSDEFIYRDGIIARMLGCMLGPDAKLRDIPSKWQDSEFVSVVHESGSAPCVPLEGICQLTDVGKEDHAALLNARIDAVRRGEITVEIVVSGVEPQELERFDDAYSAHREAEEAMWLM